MFAAILALLPKVGPIVANLPEFKALIDQAMAIIGPGQKQEDLKRAYELAKVGSDDAHADLQELVRQHTVG